MQCVRHDSLTPQKMKVMYGLYAFCWNSKEAIVQFSVSRGSTMNGNRYIEMLSDHLHPNLKIKRRGRIIEGVIYHQDNAPPHTAAATYQTLQDLRYLATSTLLAEYGIL